MIETNNAFSIELSMRLPAQASTLTQDQKDYILSGAYHWLDGTKLKKHTHFVTQTQDIYLEHSIIKINGQVYALHRKKIAEGGEGKIKWVENLRDGTFDLIKISSTAWGANEEAYTLKDAGLCRGYTKRIGVFKNNPNYQEKHYIIMPYLGPDIKQHLRALTQNIPQILESNELRFKLAICMLWELTKFHWGTSFISGRGYLHHDLKPQNIVLGEQGMYLIDYGMASIDPERYVYQDRGTAPYYPNVSKTLIRQQMHDVSLRPKGRLMDIEAARQIVRNILTDELLEYYNLEPFLEAGYLPQEQRYAKEYELHITHAITLSAVLIAAQLKPDAEIMHRIIEHKTFAAGVITAYFSFQDSWLTNGQAHINNLLGESSTTLETYLALLKLDIVDSLKHDALTHPELRQAMRPEVDKSVTRAAALLFQKGQLTPETYNRLLAHRMMPDFYIWAHFNNKADKLKLLMLNPDIIDALNAFDKYIENKLFTWSDFKFILDYPEHLQTLIQLNNYHEITYLKNCLQAGDTYDPNIQHELYHLNPRTRAILHLCPNYNVFSEVWKEFTQHDMMRSHLNRLKYFDLTSDMLLIMYENKKRLIQLAHFLPKKHFDASVILYHFLSNTTYRKAINTLLAYHQACPEEHVDAVLNVLFVGAPDAKRLTENAEGYFAVTNTPDRKHLEIGYTIHICETSNLSKLMKQYDNLTFDMLWRMLDALNNIDHFLDALPHLKIRILSETRVTAFTALLQKNLTLTQQLGTLSTVDAPKVYKYLLSGFTFAPSLYNSKDTQAKLKIIAFMSSHMDLIDAYRALNNDVFIDTSLALYHTPLFTFNDAITSTQLNYPFLLKCMLKLQEDDKLPPLRKNQALKAIEKLCLSIDKLNALYLTTDHAEYGAQQAILHEALSTTHHPHPDDLSSVNTSGPQYTFKALKNFAGRKDVIFTVKQLEKKLHSSNHMISHLSFFTCCSGPKVLHDITSSIKTLEKSLKLPSPHARKSKVKPSKVAVIEWPAL